MKTSEEAYCENPKCQYKFTDTLPSLTKVEKEWISSSNVWTIKVSGTAFTGTKDTTELVVGGITQTTTAVVPNQAVFTISNVTDLKLSDIRVYFDVGIPNGRELLNPVINLEPKLINFSIKTGSPGGSLIIANVQGVGKDTKIDNFVYGANNDQKLCQSVIIKTYGKVECLTNIQEIPSQTEIKLKLGDGTVHNCGNSDPQQCHYS